MRVVILGAGFGGLELSTMLSEAFGAEGGVTLIERADAFVFGFSKLDVLFGHATPESVRMPYRDVVHSGVRVLHETVTAIDPEARRVTTDGGEHEADVLVIALGADYDLAATPGLTDERNFYSVTGAQTLAPAVAAFSSGHAVVGVCGAPYKCTPAPSECALLLHDELVRRGVRDACRITFVLPMGGPVPPSPPASAAIRQALDERDIAFMPGRRIASVADGAAILDDGSELEFDLFLGVPKHRAPDVVIASGLAQDGFVPVDPATLQTSHAGVYAIGDVATAGVPKAGMFAENSARVLGQNLIAERRGSGERAVHRAVGSCYVEFGGGTVGRVDLDFDAGAEPAGTFAGPSAELAADKRRFAAERRTRWFGGAA